MHRLRTRPPGRAIPALAGAAALLLVLVSTTVTAQVGLVQVYADALAHNAAFRARIASVQALDQRLLQAEGQLLPQVGLRGSYDHVDEDIEGRYFGIVDVDNQDSFDRVLFGVQLTQAVYRPELVIARDQAALGQAAARFRMEADENQLMLEVTETYFAVLAAQDLARFARAEVEALTTQLEQVRARAAAGLATPAELAAARAEQALAAAREVQADAGLEASLAALDLVSGRVYRHFKALPEGMVLQRPDPATVAPWLARARSQNLGVLGAQATLRIAELELEKARKTRWPRVDAAAGAFHLDNGGGLTGDRTETESRIGVQLNLPIYAGGSLQAKVAEAEAEREAAAALLAAAEQDAERQARLAYLQTFNGISLVPARRTALEAAREAEAAIAGGFEAGTLGTTEVLRSIRERYDAEREYAAVRYTFMLDSLRLKQAAGDLTNADLARFDRILRAPSATPGTP